MRKKMHQTGKFFSFILLGLGCLCLISGGILIGRQMSASPKAESSAPEEVPYEQEKITDAEVTGEFYYEQLSDGRANGLPGKFFRVSRKIKKKFICIAATRILQMKYFRMC